MKYKIYTALMFLIGVGLLCSCTSEEHGEIDVSSGGKGKLTIAISGARNAASTYSVASVGREDEFNDLTIYMFDLTSGTLENIFSGGSISYGTSSAGGTTATIDVTERTGGKVLFFVANTAGVAAKLADAKYGQTAIGEFQQTISDELTGLPDAPMLMSAKVAIDDIENPGGDIAVSLQRRVARFDVDNDADITNFTIQRILLSKFSRQGYVFGSAVATPGEEMEAGNFEIGFGSNTGENEGATPSVFYAYPTTLEAGKASISVEGEFNGTTRIFTVVPNANLDLLANKRYTLKAQKVDINNIEFEIVVEEWGEGGEVEAEPNENKMTVSLLSAASGDGTMSADRKTFNVFNASEESVLKFTASTFMKSGSRVEIEYTVGDAADMPISVSDPEAVITYGIRYEQEYEITIPLPQGKPRKHVEATLRVINNADPYQREFFYIQSKPVYPTTEIAPVLFGGIWWAPVNVGATKLNDVVNVQAVDEVGYLYQWGRTYRSAYGTTNDVVTGPLTIAQANSAANINKHILGHTDAPYDWLNPHNDGLWSGVNSQGPCPDGWRLPLKAELELVKRAYDRGDAVFGNQRLEINGDEAGIKLYFPLGGYRSYTDNGKSNAQGLQTVFWASDTESSGWAICININSTNSIISVGNGYSRANGLSIRCVKND